MTDDATLLRSYAMHRSETAFAELVRRHLPLVYSAALRRLGGDAAHAADVAQIVFASLARDAGRLSRYPVLTGWLHTATRNVAIDLVRSEGRRRSREKEAYAMHENPSVSEATVDWENLKPVLDVAIDQLGDRDRELVLLRYFQDRPFADIAGMCGLSEDGARKRVERALDKLGILLRRQGITSTSAALMAVMAGNTISATPSALVSGIIAGAVATSGASGTAMTLLTMTKLQMGIAAVVLIGGAAGLISQHFTIADLRGTGADMQQQLVKLAAENADSAKLRAEANTEIARLNAEIAALKDGARNTTRTGNSIETPRPGVGQNAILQTTVVDSPAMQQRKAQMHGRYDPFFQQRGLTSAQADRFVELMIQMADAREDLQTAVREAGLPYGDGAEVEALRSKANQPIVRELHALLGEDGYAAYAGFEKTSYYRAAFVDPMTSMFSSANMPLSSEQTELLVSVVANNDHPIKLRPTDIGTESQIDWDSVLAQAEGMLSPAQMTVIKAYAGLRKSAK
jgi:RNA polymerase sigma factor (sigma-70 family)